MDSNSKQIELPNEHYKNAIKDVIKQHNIKDYEIDISLASGKGDNYLGELYRIIVTGVNDRDEETKLSLVLKIPPQSEIIRTSVGVGKIYSREAFVYDVFLPELKELQDVYDIADEERFPIIKSYRTCSDNLKEYIIMEDLCVEGFKVLQRKEPLCLKQVKMILKKMAKLHAMSFVLKIRNADKFELFKSNTFKIEEFFVLEMAQMMIMTVNKSVDAIEDETLKDILKEFGEGLFEKYKFYINPKSAEPYSVICHGDCWNNNLMFKMKEDELVDSRFVDWQMVKYASGVTDIAYFLFTSTDYDLRKKHFSELMDYYYDCLGLSLNSMEFNIAECYPRSVFEEHLKIFLPFGITTAIMLLPNVVSEAEDVVNVEDVMSEDALEVLTKKQFSKVTQERFAARLEGVIKTFVDLNLL